MRQGYERKLDTRRRTEAAWVSWIVSASSGSVISVSTILGEDEQDTEQSQKADKKTLRAAERKIRRMEKKYAKVMGGK